MNPLVSVIIPVYNVKPFLKNTINSVIQQTYSNIEVIIIDDGSTDGSSKILDEYVLNVKKKIKLKHIENKGLSNARNVGLELAIGDYILFLDGDDWFDTSAIENLVQVINDSKIKIDLLMFPYIREYGNKSIKRKLFSENYKIFNAEEFNETYKRLIGPYQNEISKPGELDVLSTAWGKLYSREIIKHEFLPYSVAYPEDTLFNIKNLIYVKRAIYTEVTSLHYNRLDNNDNAVTKRFSFDNYLNSNNFMTYIGQYIKDNNFDDEYEERLTARTILRLFSFMLSLSVSSLPLRKKIYFGKYIVTDPLNEENFKKFKKSRSQLPMSWRVFYYLMEKKQVKLVVIVLQILGKARSKING